MYDEAGRSRAYFSLEVSGDDRLQRSSAVPHQDQMDGLNRRDDMPLREEAELDVDAMLSSLDLQLVRRYMDQRHWHEESEAARAADRVEPGLKLENVAAHSWHVADATMLLAPNFPEVDQRRAVELAVVHDKLELLTGDFDPVGPDGQGTSSHAFDPKAQAEKTEVELRALDHYLARLREPARNRQRALLLETIRGETAEARLVKAVDKLQALSFVLAKKAGNMTDEHLCFSLRYSFKAVEYFPKVAVHHAVLVIRLLTLVAGHRRVTLAELLRNLPPQIRPLTASAEA